MPLLKLVRFPWANGVFATEPETVYFNEADLVVMAPPESGDVLVRAKDKEGRIWAQVGLTLEQAERLAGHLQIAIASQELIADAKAEHAAREAVK